MKKKMWTTKMLVFSLLTLFCVAVQAQQDAEEYTINGHIKDAATGEELINASLFIRPANVGTVSNVYGYYSITLPKGEYTLDFSYLGYQNNQQAITLDKDMRLDIELSENENILSEVVISSKEEKENVSSNEMSKVKVDIEAVKKLPALFGEVDIIKAIQMLPGVKSVGEGTSGFYVRGGNVDQNLVLLDEAPIYNASHMLGFFSAFNPDAIKDMQLYKGAIAPRYGGRLSSVLDIRMKDGNSKKFAGSAGLGTIMSRLALEMPISDNGSFIISGRRSYLDVLAALVVPGEVKDSKFYFYDLNAKGNYRFGENDRIFLSGYFGRDVAGLSTEGFGVEWGNKTATARWNHIFTPKLFSNLTLYYSDYDYFLSQSEELNSFRWDSRLKELSGKMDFTAFLSPSNTLRFGVQSIRHQLSPGEIRVTEKDMPDNVFLIQENQSIENGIYINDELSITDDFQVNFGIRGSSLHNTGPQTHYITNSENVISDSTVYNSGIYNSYYNLEPRIGIKYAIDDKQSIKASYNRTSQYIQLASNGNASTPFDIWFTASPNVKPQLADQYGVGYFRNFFNNSVEFSAEVYYKNFINAIDFRERAVLLLNKNIEGELRIGKARAYGIEFLLKKDVGKLTGWLGYTYAKVEKQIDQINEGKWYNAKYDKPHELSIVASYAVSDRFSLSSNFTIASGSAVTFPTGRYVFQGTIVPVYSERNAERLPTYHRMDVSASYKPNKKMFGSVDYEWVFSIYNLYNRKNALAINFKQDENNPNQSYAEKSAVFSIVPSVTFNAKF